MNVTGTSFFFDRARDRLTMLGQSADTLQTQISTGKKLTAASQDSAAWQRLQGLAQAKADTSAYGGNIQFARSVLATTDSTLSAIQTQLQRASELAIQANTGTLSAENRAVIADQLDAIAADLAALGNATDTRGLPLFDATAAGIPVADGVTIPANEDKARVFGTILATISGYATQLRAADGSAVPANSATAIAALGAASSNVASIQGTVGARAARVELIAASAEDAAAVTETQRSALEDTDLTASIADLQKTMTILQATQASFTRLSQLSLFDYLR